MPWRGTSGSLESFKRKARRLRSADWRVPGVECGGATVDACFQDEYPHHRMLRMLAGIVFSDDFGALDELVEHCRVPETFDLPSDSYWVSKTTLELSEQWTMPIDNILAGFTNALDEVRLEFGEAANEIAAILLDQKPS